MGISRGGALAAALVVTGCAAAPKMVWLRTDGQRMNGNAALTQQAAIDAQICSGERQVR
jgi:hypothetical protein